MPHEVQTLARATGRSVGKQLDRAQVEAWFEAADNVFRTLGMPLDWGVPTLNTVDKSPKEVLSIQWSNLRAPYAALDCEALNWRHRRAVRRHLRRDLPELLSAYAGLLIKYELEDVTSSEGLSKKRRRLRTSILAIVHQQRQPGYAGVEAPRGVGVAGGHEAARNHFALLSQIGEFDAALGSATQALLQDWKWAAGHDLSTEERYRLDQMVDELLPEIAKALPRVSEAARAEASALIAEQLGMLHARVRAVLARHELDAIGVLRAQSNFIRELDAQSGGHLALEGAGRRSR